MLVMTRIITQVSWSTTSLWRAMTESQPSFRPGIWIQGPMSATIGVPPPFTVKNSNQAMRQLAATTPQDTNATSGFGSFRPMNTWKTKPKTGRSGTSQTKYGETEPQTASAWLAPCSWIVATRAIIDD